MPSINAVTFDHWEGSLTGHNAAGGEKPDSIRTGTLFADDGAAYAALATWRQWPDPDTAYTVVLAGGESVADCRIFGVEAEGLIAVTGGVLLWVRWDVLAPESWDPTP